MLAKRFIREMFGHWTSGMTGGLSLPFALAVAFVPELSQRVLLGALALLCFCYAVFRMWRAAVIRLDEHERKTLLDRPFVVPEVSTDRSTHAASVFVSNVGTHPALGVVVRPIRSFDGSATFAAIQTLKASDGRVELPICMTGGRNDLRSILGSIHIAAALHAQREGKSGTDFVVPLTLRYFDHAGREFEDNSFEFSWIPSPTGAPIDTQLVIKRSRATVSIAAATA
jgi:hypothetical protein